MSAGGGGLSGMAKLSRADMLVMVAAAAVSDSRVPGVSGLGGTQI